MRIMIFEVSWQRVVVYSLCASIAILSGILLLDDNGYQEQRGSARSKIDSSSSGNEVSNHRHPILIGGNSVKSERILEGFLENPLQCYHEHGKKYGKDFANRMLTEQLVIVAKTSPDQYSKVLLQIPSLLVGFEIHEDAVAELLKSAAGLGALSGLEKSHHMMGLTVAVARFYEKECDEGELPTKLYLTESNIGIEALKTRLYGMEAYPAFDVLEGWLTEHSLAFGNEAQSIKKLAVREFGSVSTNDAINLLRTGAVSLEKDTG